MEIRYYKDYFRVPADYSANMTREKINETPETWLDFYPHAKYIEFLRTLFDGAKSVWLTGNYGTGKSNAALVTHKLFMDDISRVDKWFEANKSVIVNCDDLKKKLIEARNEGFLVIYDYNASGIGPDEELLVRLEKGILAALKENGYTSPANANLDLVIERIKREGENFFKTRDSMISEMKSLKADIKTVDQLISKLIEEGTSSSKVPTHYLEDVQAVLHKDNIYLNVNVSTFRKWISDICSENGISRIIYIFDEFSEFIDHNSGTLKTFEDVTEAPATNHFYLVPVTHKELNAFYGENSPGANKAKDRFYFRNLQMPNDIAFQLAGHAMKPVEDEPYQSEWKEEKELLWRSIVSVVDKFNDPDTSEAYVSRESFMRVLPIHPMAAFLLKFLSESARSNQRSIFEYLKGSADGREFQEFIATGGPRIPQRQFLTTDYLWKYFMEREDSGQSKEIINIKMEYDRIKAREFNQYNDDQPEIRVLKTVMLFTLLSKLNPNGHDRLRPTVENIELSFRGDGVIMDVSTLLRDLSENRHCFSIVNGTIELYSTTVGGEDLESKKSELVTQFHDLLSEKCAKELLQATKGARTGFSGERFSIRVSDASHTTLTNITQAVRNRYGTGPDNDGSICLWFVIAKNRDERMQIRGKEESLLRNLQGHRIIMIDFPDITFCEKNVNLWDEYITLQARLFLENNDNSKKMIEKSITGIETEWFSSIKAPNTVLNLSYFDTDSEQIVSKKSSWADLKLFLPDYTRQTLECCPDLITDQMTVFSNKALKSWALAGINFNGTNQLGQLVNGLKSQGIEPTDSWFAANPNHLFTKIKAFLKKKYDNTVGKNADMSLRKVFIDLKRAPYGMRMNCLSAFTIGFCLSWILEKNCQWTNGQFNTTLDDVTLAEIIESAVQEKNDKEKLICRLSKEEKYFAENAGRIFGLSEVKNSTPIDTLRSISEKVEGNSYKVPLWVLAEYIRSCNPEHETIANILDDLCIAMRISSKGDIQERAAVISRIGAELIKSPELIDIASNYTKSELYIAAFRKYVDCSSSDLSSLALQIEDKSHAYCDLILKNAAPVSGWLWNKSDISSLINQTEQTYRFIVLGRKVLGITGYISFEDITKRLLDKMKSSGFPYSIAGLKYPDLEKLANELTGEKNASTLLNIFNSCERSFDNVYNDPKKQIIVDLIHEQLGNTKISKALILSIVSDAMSTDAYRADMSVDEYLKMINNLIAQNVRTGLIRQNNDELKRICGYDNLAKWSLETHLPGWTLFSDAASPEGIASVLLDPQKFTDDVLEQYYNMISVLPKADIMRCQKVFLGKIVPEKYKKLEVSFSSILSYLEKMHGKDPNQWPLVPDIQKYITEHYQEMFAPAVLNAIRDKKAEEIKTRIMELAKNDPDIGLKFLES